eukprot:COSAG03_NODE_3311_length_2090_cov_24.871631_1_plen_77_part_10
MEMAVGSIESLGSGCGAAPAAVPSTAVAASDIILAAIQLDAAATCVKNCSVQSSDLRAAALHAFAAGRARAPTRAGR